MHQLPPFKGDRNHIHHRLQQLGFTTNQIVVALSFFSGVMITLSLFMQHWGNFAVISVIIIICVILNAIITYKIGKRRDRKYKLIDVILVDTFRIIK